ncbi:MAG TPA: D-alanyl-D-alanine carboxypeptidase/D-alanyl-D-alanine-endopeptidase [Burkholderiaceae bacterium]
MPPRPTSLPLLLLLRCGLAPLLAALLLAGAPRPSAAQPAQTLPPEVEAALARARLPREALSVLVVDAQGKAPPRLAFNAQVPMNPASVMKLVTTYAALDQLGPAWSWATPVYADGPVRDGVLHGNLYIRGQGDPKLVVERLWLLLRRVQGLGIRAIAGDIVLDRSAFEVAEQDPGDFDGERLRPYNATPDALLLNFKSLVLTFVPDRAAGTASIASDVRLAGVALPASVPLVAGECGDWRGTLRADFSDPARIRMVGGFPASCGERVWPLAYTEPASHARRVVEGLWRDLGGQLAGKVREGRPPPGLRPVFEMTSPTLAEVVRDINKFSNNVMAQQVFLTLSLAARGTGTLEGSRELVRGWWRNRFGDTEPAPLIDNGSGLSRNERITAQALGHMLQLAWASPVMPELLASLPISGMDGTLRRSTVRLPGSAHLKTGSLRDVVSLAGYVDAASGRRQVLVAFVNHPNANAARPALDALVEWAARDQ